MNVAMKECCNCCSQTRALCLQTMQSCLKKGGKFADAKLCMMLMECAQTCQLLADLCSTGSGGAAKVAEACAKLCDECARCCDAMSEPELSKCAESLRRCAQACSQVCAKIVA